ncbi:cytochrome P450 3A41 [Caerostris extrusa]|uniref:Cytochrome P450 3A41 n=1 Tax=Caerostris extrusa TaxID=172846 RepID=A0AAV4R571_CAEEX|nr:cytochrome P450 3A41 [Caerostris extrusa]
MSFSDVFGNFTYTWTLAAIIVILSAIKKYLGRNDDYWKKQGIPFLPRPNYFYLLFTIGRKNIYEFIKDITRLGRVVGSFEGSNPAVMVAEPDLLRDILVKDFHVFPYRRIMETGDPIADNMVSIMTGEDWKRVRTIITPAFTSKRMRQMGTIMNECSKSVVEVCEKHFNEGKPVDFKSVFGAYTMDVIAKSAFATKINSYNDPQNIFVRKVREGFLKFTIPRMLIAILLPGWILKHFQFLNPMKFDRDNFFRDVTMSVIKQRKETGQRYNDFLQLMMDAADETAQTENSEYAEDETDRFGSITNNGLTPSTKYKKLSEVELLAQCIIFFMVGYETTATLLTFVCYCLATNPEWQEKLIKEVDDAFVKHKEMSYEAVRDMKILDAVVSETLRIHPPSTSTERTAVEDYALGNTGITIKKGMRVSIPAYAMHFDPEFFQDPQTFNPERFMEGYEPKHPQYAYLPFGAGPRNCLGMRFALLEVKMCLANLLRNFKLKTHSTTKVPLQYSPGMVLLTVKELPLTVEKRTLVI